MLSLLEIPGFLGTKASLLSDISLILCLLSLILFVIGGVRARQHKIRQHGRIQTIAYILVILAVVAFMAPVYSSQYESASVGISSFLPNGLVAIHAILGGFTLLFGLYVIFLGFRILPKSLRIKNTKLVMQIAMILFIILILSGIGIYINLYV